LVTSVLAGGQVDLEISTLRPTERTVRGRRLLVEPLWLAVPSMHPLARRSRIQLAEASSEPFIVLRPTSLLRQLCDDLCQGAGFQPTVGFEGDDLPTVRGFVAAGLGVAIVPALHQGPPDTARGLLHHLEITDTRAVREIGLAWSTERGLLPAAELFSVTTRSAEQRRDCPRRGEELVTLRVSIDRQMDGPGASTALCHSGSASGIRIAGGFGPVRGRTRHSHCACTPVVCVIPYPGSAPPADAVGVAD
jgi:hypothetical protein